MSVTVLIPTVGRSAGLRRLLDALAAQTHPDWEVLIVDNTPGSRAPVAGAQAVVDEVTAAVALPQVTVIHEPRPGAAHARTAGVAAVATPLVALLDDDVVPAPGWLAAVTAAFADREVAGVGGRVVLDADAPRPSWLDAALAGYLTELDLGARPRDLSSAEYLLTANAAFRTDVLAGLGFDSRLGPRPGLHLTNDDLDLSRRAMAAGHRLVWRPAAVVVHDLPAHRTRLRWLLGRLMAQGRSDWRLDAQVLATRRAWGLRVAWQDVVGAPRRWWGRTATPIGWVVHVLADTAHGVGFAREALASRRAASAHAARRRP